MRIQRRDYNDITVVQLQGDLDMTISSTSQVVEDVVSSPSGINEGNQSSTRFNKRACVHMSEVGFIDSKAGVFIWADYCHGTPVSFAWRT